VIRNRLHLFYSFQGPQRVSALDIAAMVLFISQMPFVTSNIPCESTDSN